MRPLEPPDISEVHLVGLQVVSPLSLVPDTFHVTAPKLHWHCRPQLSIEPPMNPYLLVGIGGVLGCLARYAVSVGVGSMPNGFPLGIFVINVIGSTAMGVLIGVLAKTTPQYQNEIRLFVAVGMLGGFTTFSSFSLDAITLIERGDFLLAAIYIVGSVILSLAGLWLGLSAIRVVL